MSIGIFTFNDGTNYGATYQMYALQQVLSKYDKRVEVVQYKLEKKKEKVNIKKLAFIPIKIIREYKFKKFRKKYIRFSKYKYNTNSIKSNPPIYDVYVTGSDQVWNPRTMNENIRDVYFLNIGNKEIKRVAYAPSIGVQTITKEDETYIRKRLENLDYISIREETGKNLITKLTEKNIEVTIDPTLLLKKNDWIKIEKNIKLPNEKYIFIYTIEPDEKVNDIINYIVKKKKMKVIHVGLLKKYQNEIRKPFANPNEFLSLIHNADLVLTNSFHGTVFSLVYQKDFYSFSRNGMNSRIKNLLEKVELNDRLIENIKDIDKCSHINYDKVQKCLDFQRDKSIKFIEKSLGL